MQQRALSDLGCCDLQAAGMRHSGRRKVKLENQDFLCNEAHMSGKRQERSLFGVFDGHGAFGKPIAQHASWLLPNFADVAMQEAQQVTNPCLVCRSSIASNNGAQAASQVSKPHVWEWQHPQAARLSGQHSTQLLQQSLQPPANAKQHMTSGMANNGSLAPAGLRQCRGHLGAGGCANCLLSGH